MPTAKISLSPVLEIQIEGTNEQLLQGLSFWGSIPHQCPICESPVTFTFRTPTAKQGSREGEKFTYYGLICSGIQDAQGEITQHEALISPRKPTGSDSFFIRDGNRKDKKPNWRVAFSSSHNDDDDDDSQSGGQSRSFAPPEQTSALEKEANGKGVAYPEMNKECVKKYGCGYKQLTRTEALEYLALLRAL